MSRLPLFNSPLLLGFDHLNVPSIGISEDGRRGLPPITSSRSAKMCCITLAVAGLVSEDLDIRIEDNQLIVRAGRSMTLRASISIAVAARQFQRSFVPAEGIEVIGGARQRPASDRSQTPGNSVSGPDGADPEGGAGGVTVVAAPLVAMTAAPGSRRTRSGTNATEPSGSRAPAFPSINLWAGDERSKGIRNDQ